MPSLPTFEDVLAAAQRIAPYATATPVLHSRTLDALAGCELHFKAEHLQRSGAFKFRGACNAVWALSPEQAACGVVTHSSGNHGAALALAARTRGIACHVVVPEGAVAAKLANIERHGATLWRCASSIAAREATCARVQAQTDAPGFLIAMEPGLSRRRTATRRYQKARTRVIFLCPGRVSAGISRG